MWQKSIEMTFQCELGKCLCLIVPKFNRVSHVAPMFICAHRTNTGKSSVMLWGVISVCVCVHVCVLVGVPVLIDGCLQHMSQGLGMHVHSLHNGLLNSSS